MRQSLSIRWSASTGRCSLTEEAAVNTDLRSRFAVTVTTPANVVIEGTAHLSDATKRCPAEALRACGLSLQPLLPEEPDAPHTVAA